MYFITKLGGGIIVLTVNTQIAIMQVCLTYSS